MVPSMDSVTIMVTIIYMQGLIVCLEDLGSATCSSACREVSIQMFVIYPQND